MTREAFLKSNNHHQREELNANIQHIVICKENNSNFDLNESDQSLRQDVKCFDMSVVSDPCERGRKRKRRRNCIRIRKKSTLSSSLPCLLQANSRSKFYFQNQFDNDLKLRDLIVNIKFQ